MGSFQRNAKNVGIVVPGRAGGDQAFVQVDPDVLESVDAASWQDWLPSAAFVDFNPLDYLKYLGDLEAEILWMILDRGKAQGDIGKLLGLSQPTISYRYRRTQEKLAYLVMLTAVDVREIVSGFDFLTERERDVLVNLFYYVNQEAVGKLYKPRLRQSSVKWIAVKTRNKLEELEPTDPDRWFNALCLVYWLFSNLGIRIRSE